DATTGSWNLQSGTIIGGAITASGGAELVLSIGTLDGVTLSTGLTVGNFLTVKNGLTLNGPLILGSAGGVQFLGTQTLGGTGEVVFAGASNLLSAQGNGTQAGAASLTIGPNIT